MPMRRLCLLLLSLAAPLFSAPAIAAEPLVVAAVDSPGKVLRVELSLDEGRIAWRASRLGEPIVAPSRLGFLLRDAEKLERNFVLVEQHTSARDETWQQPWGENRLVRDHHVELRARFAESMRAKRTLDLVFRVFDDGIGFRYEFPQESATDVVIDDELTEFNLVAPAATAWWIPAGEWNRYEYLYQRTPIEQVGQVHTPVTFRLASGLHVAIHEAALVDYAGMWLRRVEGTRFKAVLSPASEGWKVRRRAPFTTPWRTLRVADTAAALYESNLELNLNAPNQLGDTSWFKPAKYVGVWWELHLENSTWATGPKHGATTANTRRYIDFAAENGFRGVLVEGWNRGWDGQWFGDGNDFDFTRATDDFDLEGLAAYAKQRGVHLVGHHETGGAVSHYERQLGDALDLYRRLGIDVLKSGYVADAGQIERNDGDGLVHREWHDGQWMVRHHERVVREAAARHIAVNPHEPVKDTGLRRTWPNWVSREGARGMEYAAWGNPPNPPEHEVNLVFTRMLAGPMDFTPGILSLMGRKQPLKSTLARQLALYVVLYSPIQMVADLPANYARQPEAFRFIRDVAVDWETTRVLAGEVGDYVVFARRERGGDTWFLGGITDENGRVLDVPLAFLEPKRRYVAEIYRDGDDAHWRDNPFDFVRETREVGSADTLRVRLAAGGGQAIRFVPKR
ncbi:MAG: glycoside hydrolase family 97 protein [Xanthomonadales bacterium]|nr:glycoside hydrolase family 97 protein [Xanthomonadales bacterium]